MLLTSLILVCIQQGENDRALNDLNEGLGRLVAGGRKLNNSQRSPVSTGDGYPPGRRRRLGAAERQQDCSQSGNQNQP